MVAGPVTDIKAARARSVLTALAKHFRAELTVGPNPRSAHFVALHERGAIEIVAIEPLFSSRSQAVPPRLRFDRVVMELLRRLRADLDPVVPAGTTIVVTVTAPIRVSGKTAIALSELARGLVASKAAPRVLKKALYGNQIRMCVLRCAGWRGRKVIGFVHNRESDPRPLVRLASVLQRKFTGVARRARAGHRSLAVAIGDDPVWMKTYGHVTAQLLADSSFERVVVVGVDGRVLDPQR